MPKSKVQFVKDHLTLNKIFRPECAQLFTVGQLSSMYRPAKPDELESYINKPPILSETKFILVSGRNAQIPENQRRLPSHIVLADGQTLLLLRNIPARVLDTPKEKDEHSRMYANLFLYVPFSDEESFLGEARRSLEACHAKWLEFGAAATDLRNQLRTFVTESWLG